MAAPCLVAVATSSAPTLTPSTLASTPTGHRRAWHGLLLYPDLNSEHGAADPPRSEAVRSQPLCPSRAPRRQLSRSSSSCNLQCQHLSLLLARGALERAPEG